MTGVLPVALSRACRLNEYFMHKNKAYIGIMRLHKSVSMEKLKEVIKEFIGKIEQLPPIRSSVKRAIRVREIISFEILEINEKDILFETEVEAGTYIRKLIHDMGEKLDGAHMLELRRIKAGIFSEEKSVSMYEFDEAVKEYKNGNEELLRKMLIPGEIVSEILPNIEVKSKSIKQLLTGKPIFVEDLVKKENFEENSKICVLNEGKFIGIYSVFNKGDIIARPEFVFN